VSYVALEDASLKKGMGEMQDSNKKSVVGDINTIMVDTIFDWAQNLYLFETASVGSFQGNRMEVR
jgi:hypothetical protein